MSLGHRGHNLLEGIFLVLRQGQWLLIYYTTKKRIMMCRVVGGARAVDGQEECLGNQILGDVFGFGSGVTTEGSHSFFFILTTD